MDRSFAACALAGTLVLVASLAAAADESSYSFTVRRSRLVGSSSGTLRITGAGVEYETRAKNESRRWTYPDIKQLQIRSSKRIVILTYEDQGWLRLGADRAFNLELRDDSVKPETVAFLLSRTDRPIVTTVMPPAGSPPLVRLPVKHERWGRGSEGALLLYDNALAYVTEREAESRYWRFADLCLALPLDPFRYQVLAYEGGAGELRPFAFQLKVSLPVVFERDLRNGVSRRSGDGAARIMP